MTFTFTPSSGGLALTSAMTASTELVLSASLLLLGERLLELKIEPLAAPPGRLAAGSTFQAACEVVPAADAALQLCCAPGQAARTNS